MLRSYLAIVAHHVPQFITTSGHFKQNNTLCHKIKILLDWFMHHSKVFSVLSF